MLGIILRWFSESWWILERILERILEGNPEAICGWRRVRVESIGREHTGDNHKTGERQLLHKVKRGSFLKGTQVIRADYCVVAILHECYHAAFYRATLNATVDSTAGRTHCRREMRQTIFGLHCNQNSIWILWKRTNFFDKHFGPSNPVSNEFSFRTTFNLWAHKLGMCEKATHWWHSQCRLEHLHFHFFVKRHLLRLGCQSSIFFLKSRSVFRPAYCPESLAMTSQKGSWFFGISTFSHRNLMKFTVQFAKFQFKSKIY